LVRGYQNDGKSPFYPKITAAKTFDQMLEVFKDVKDITPDELTVPINL